MSHKSRETPDQRAPAEATESRKGRRSPFRHHRIGAEQEGPHVEDVPPPHDQPWIPKSGLVGRIRRSARRQ